MQFRFAVGVASILAQGSSLLLNAPKQESPAASVCNLVAAPTVYSLAGLGDDATLDKNSSAVQVKDDPPSTHEKREELKDAIEHYKLQKMQYKLAEARLMRAFDSLLEVPETNPEDLTHLVEHGGRATLVVFYAAWCPHCQTFVLHDGTGDPTKAPLEQFRRDLRSNPEMAEVNVLRCDVAKHQDLPSAFKVTGIPSVFFVDKHGHPEKYGDDPHNFDSLKAFMASHM